MGWTVMGFGNLELQEGTLSRKEIDEIKEVIFEEEVGGTITYEDAMTIDFKVYGDKGIDYTFMEKIKAILNKKKGCKYTLSVIEYVGGEVGYSYDSEEEE